MKRNAILGKIWEILYKETDLEEEGLKLLSEQILDMVEKNGMYPPLNEDEYNYMDNSNRLAVNNALPYFTWEKE